MKCAKYLTAVVFGTLVYVLLSMFVGQNSIRCYNELDEQKKIISKQANDIMTINDELKLEYYALQNDMAVIAAYAHKLDYVAPDEKLVKVTGLPPVQTNLYDTGTVVRHEDPDFLPEKICKIIGIGSGILVFLIVFMIDLSLGNISFKKKVAVKGIPVYDLPQV